MKKHQHLNWTFFFSLGIALVAIPFGLVQAVDTAIVLDPNFPTAATLPPTVPDPNTGGTIQPINQNNGQAAGNNLFYSFNQFNIGSGDTAYFNFTQNWENVITRVTGGAVSFIDGTLRVGGNREVGGTPADAIAGATTITNAAKNFFFINPSGITFGPGSVVDVPGSFYASTASTLNFSDGSSFRADGTQPSVISASSPVSFGFLGNETGALVLNQAKVQVFNDETLALVGHDISIDNSTVGMVDLTIAQTGFTPLGLPDPNAMNRFTDRRPLFIDGIQLLVLANHSQNNVPIDTTGIKALGNQMDGNINISNTNLINAGGDAEEITFIRGGDITLNNASVVSSNYGDDCGGFCGSFTGNEKITGISGIDVLAKGALTLNNGHIVTETSFSPVNPTSSDDAINIQANSLLMNNGSSISSRSLNVGNITPSYIPAGIIPVLYPVNPKAGNININVNTDFVAKGGSSILSSTETFGNAGEIKLTAGSITLDNASIKSESLSNTNGLTGYVNDGHNSIYDPNRAQQDFYLDYNRFVPNQPNPYVNAIPALQTTTYNAGDAGKVTLTATSGDIKLANGSTVSTDIHSGTVNSGTAGISLTANSGAITIDRSAISSATSGDANAGDINLAANSPLQMSNNSSITTDSLGVNGAKLGNSGAISITSQTATMDTGSVISSSSKSLGSAGQISVNTTNGIALTNSSISTDVQNGTQSSQTGKIALNAQAGAITLDGSTVSSTTSGDANAGDIVLSASGPLQLSNNAKITTDSSGAKLGNSGAIAVNAKALTMDTGVISSSSKSLGSAGQITVNTPDGIALTNSSISTDVQNGTQSSQTGKIALNAQAGAITLDGSTVSSTTSGDANAGDIVLTASDLLQLSNNAKITTDSSGAKLGNSGAIAVTAKALSMNTGVISSSSKSLGSAGQISVNTANGIALTNSSISTDVQNGTQSSQTGKIALNAQAGAITMDGSTVSSTTSGDANAGDINLVASGLLQMSNGSKITTDSLGDSSKLGNSGVISIASKDLTMNTGSLISSSTNSLGNAGTVTINTGFLNIQGLGAIPISQLGHYVEPNFTGIRSTANAGSGGQTGFIDILARNNMMLTNGAQISISNKANVANTSSLVPTHINIVTPNLTMTNSQIVADSSGNVDAGDINITFTDTLYMDPSAISTLANNGNGGNIVINGGNMFWLQDSAITTSVLGLQGNGGNIDIKSDYLIMDSGFIQANTAAQGASGGTVNINVNTLIPSGSLLFVGGNSPFRFQPYSGINVIQAAAPNGVKGQINSTSPQLNLSGTLANLILQSFDQNVLSRDLCAIGDSSSLSQSGKGGLRRRAKEPLLSNAF